MQKPIVIFHGGCADGNASVWCFWKVYGDSFEYYPGIFSKEPPDVKGRDVYMVDFSYPLAKMKEMCFVAK